MRRAVRTANAPKPAAAYEQGVLFGDFIFVSGLVAIDPATGRIDATTMKDQVLQILRNIEAILEAAGGSRNDILHCGVFLSDLNQFAGMNDAFEAFFGANLPARTTVQAGLGELEVEINAIAARSRKRARKKIEKLSSVSTGE
jgi:2-iminobutanoate/2-iminopropanoate deaminase